MRRLPATPLLILALTLSVGAGAATYRWVDAQGVVHYSDTPQPGAQEIELPAAQTYRAPSADTAAATPAAPAVTPATSVYQACAITQPAAEASLFAPGSVTVSVSVAPALREGDVVAVTMDGTALPSTSPGAMSFQVTQVERGAHTLNAVVRGPDGKMLCTAPAVTFYIRQPSVYSPAAAIKPH